MCLVNSKINHLPTFKCKQNFKLGCLNVWSTLPGYFNCLLTKISNRSSVNRMAPGQCVLLKWDQNGDKTGIWVTLKQKHVWVVWISRHNHLLGFHRTVPKREHSQWAGGGAQEIALLINVRGQRTESGQTAERPQGLQWPLLRAGKDRTRAEFMTKPHIIPLWTHRVTAPADCSPSLRLPLVAP